jgi:hypothetical protein
MWNRVMQQRDARDETYSGGKSREAEVQYMRRVIVTQFRLLPADPSSSFCTLFCDTVPLRDSCRENSPIRGTDQALWKRNSQWLLVHGKEHGIPKCDRHLLVSQRAWMKAVESRNVVQIWNDQV